MTIAPQGVRLANAPYAERVGRLSRSILPDDGVYHVATRGVARSPIYLEDDDRLYFLRLLREVTDAARWGCHGFCLMTNHYHLVVATTRDLLSRAMPRLNGLYARSFNEKYGRSGHLFGDRFVARVVDDEAYLRALCRYVVENPVRAGLCDRAADWRWSASRYGFA